jgi:hypothetical protein
MFLPADAARSAPEILPAENCSQARLQFEEALPSRKYLQLTRIVMPIRQSLNPLIHRAA